MRRVLCPILRSACASLGAAAAFAVPALAGHAQPLDAAGTPSLAPPGECAQPEQEVVTSPQQGEPPFDPAGAPVAHFVPADVAAGPPAPPRPAPGEPDTPRDGGCDAPDAGCLGSLPAARGLVDSPPQPGLPPGADGRSRP